MKFSSDYTPYAQCRSMVLMGSALVSSVGSNIGEIGCAIQSNSWYITGFAALAAGSNVILQGYLDMTTAVGTYSVYTYDTRDDSSLLTTGKAIDEILS